MSKLMDTTGYEPWKLPLVSDSRAALRETTAEKLELIQKQAYEEGFLQGQKDGFIKGEIDGFELKKEQMEADHLSLSSIIELLTEPLKELDDEIVQQLAELSMTVAKQVVRRELHTEQGEIVGIVREAMSALPASTRKIILHIHPEDAVIIRKAFSIGPEQDQEDLRWKVIEDPLLTRGGCKISSENSRIDATVEARLNRVINTLLGGERESDE